MSNFLESESFTILQEVLEELYVKKNENGSYIYTIYTGYDDAPSKSTINEVFGTILSQMNNLELPVTDAICSQLTEWEIEQKDNFIYEELLPKLGHTDFNMADYEEDLQEWLCEHLVVTFSDSYFWGETVCFNLSIETGDADYEFTLNNLFELDTIGETVKQNSSLVWLCAQQGYSYEQLEAYLVAYANGRVLPFESAFLNSICEEMANTTTSCNRIDFMVSLTVGKACDILQAKKNGALRDITVPKDTYCGLVDHWNGAGGLTGIEFEKDIIIPSNVFYRLMPDESEGYGIEDIFGLIPSRVWVNDVEYTCLTL